MRPRNESAADLEREEAARVRIEKVWHCIIQPLRPEVYKCDWAIFKDSKTFIGWGEYKYRGVNTKGEPTKWETYPTVILSLGKWMTMKTLAQQSDRQFFFFAEWSDCLVYAKWPQFTGMGYPIAYGIELGGRADRDQDGDREPVIAIPNKEFKIIHAVENEHSDGRASNAGVPASASGPDARPDRPAAQGQERADVQGGGAKA